MLKTCSTKPLLPIMGSICMGRLPSHGSGSAHHAIAIGCPCRAQDARNAMQCDVVIVSRFAMEQPAIEVVAHAQHSVEPPILAALIRADRQEIDALLERG